MCIGACVVHIVYVGHMCMGWRKHSYWPKGAEYRQGGSICPWGGGNTATGQEALKRQPACMCVCRACVRRRESTVTALPRSTTVCQSAHDKAGHTHAALALRCAW